MDFADYKRKSNFPRKIFLAAGLIAVCFLLFRKSPGFTGSSKVSIEAMKCIAA